MICCLDTFQRNRELKRTLFLRTEPWFYRKYRISEWFWLEKIILRSSSNHLYFYDQVKKMYSPLTINSTEISNTIDHLETER